jgi:hypothetical protein
MTKFGPERCGRQIPVGTVAARKMWTAGYNLVCGCWRDVGEKFELKQFLSFELRWFSLERCG